MSPIHFFLFLQHFYSLESWAPGWGSMPVVNTLLGGGRSEEGIVLISIMYQAFEKYGVIIKYKENGIGCLLISATDT